MSDMSESLALRQVIQKLSQLSNEWDKTADAEESKWYNESSAYRECAEALDDLLRKIDHE